VYPVRYTTVLWHLKKEVALSHLAQEAVALDRLSPHTWWGSAR
jgi:anaphase-promoting complex subunit 3